MSHSTKFFTSVSNSTDFSLVLYAGLLQSFRHLRLHPSTINHKFTFIFKCNTEHPSLKIQLKGYLTSGKMDVYLKGVIYVKVM